MKNQTKKSAQVENVQISENNNLQKLIDTLNASNAIENLSKKRDLSNDRIWTKEFRNLQGGKISNSHRNKLAQFFGRIANYTKAQKFDLAISELEKLKNWASDKLQNLEFSDLKNYTNFDINANPNFINPSHADYKINVDCINAGLTAIKILKAKNLCD